MARDDISAANAPFPTPLFPRKNRNRTASDVEANKVSPVSEMNPADFVKHEEEIPKMADSTCPELKGSGQTVDH